MKELNKKNSFINRLLIFSFIISLIVFIWLFVLFLSQPKLQPIDMNRWKYEKKYGFYYQDDIIYYNNLIEVTKATLSIYYPKNLLSCRDEYKFYKCKSNSNNDIMAMFLLDYNEKLPKHIIKNYTDSNIIIIKPNFHNPYKAYDIILSISEIKASIKYISANLKENQLYVIGYGIFGEICNILGASINNENFTNILGELETEDGEENIHGIISIMPYGGFDIGNSGFEWAIGNRRKFPEKKYEECFDYFKIHNQLIAHYENYTIENLNYQAQEDKETFLEDYKEKFKKEYNFYYNDSGENITDSFPIYDEIINESDLNKFCNRLFGNYIKEKPQHFDKYLSILVKNNGIPIDYTDFSKKNNFGKNFDVTERVNLASPLYYLKDFNNNSDYILPKFWAIFSNKNFLMDKQFPNEYNYFFKLNNLIKLNTSIQKNFFFKNMTMHILTLEIFKNKTQEF